MAYGPAVATHEKGIVDRELVNFFSKSVILLYLFNNMDEKV